MGYAVSVRFVRGAQASPPDGRGYQRVPLYGYEYFRRFRSVARIGAATLIYHITPDEADAARSEDRLPPLATSPKAHQPGRDRIGGEEGPAMKLVIQIPCLNEAEILPMTLAALPREVEGFDVVEVLVIDDGSTDGTGDVARACGADHVVRLPGHQGLARAYMAGLAAAIELEADIIVNTDADNQYNATDIPALVRPILTGEADIVVGARPIWSIAHFSPVKRLLQNVGSRVVQAVSGADIQDAPSGFRAVTRDAALRLNVFGRFTYSIETLIQAGLANLRVVSVPIRVNSPTRTSRLFRSNLRYVCRNVLTIAHVYLIYRPARLFAATALGFLIPAFLLALRYVGLMAGGEGKGHVHSLILAATLALAGVVAAACGVVAHLLGINRRLLEELRYRSLSAATAPAARAGTGRDQAGEKSLAREVRIDANRVVDGPVG